MSHLWYLKTLSPQKTFSCFLIFVHAGTVLYDLRLDWTVKAFAPLTFYPIGQDKREPPSTPLSIGWRPRQYSYVSNAPAPEQKASLRLSLTVTQECPYLPPRMPTVCTNVRDCVIRSAAGELYTEPLKAPWCPFKAPQSVSD